MSSSPVLSPSRAESGASTGAATTRDTFANRTTKMLRGSAAVISLSAALFASAGTAQATDPTYFYNSNNSMQVTYGA